MPTAKRPTLDQIEKYAQYLESQGKDPSDVAKYAQYLMKEHGYDRPEAGSIQEKLQSALQSQYGQAATKALDYLGGLGRTAVAHTPVGLLARGVAGSEPLSLEQAGKDITSAVKGEAPSTGEYLERAGVPQGPALSDIAPSAFNYTGQGLALQRGGPLDVTARGAAGFVGDVTTDPLTYMGAGLLGKTAGKGLYKSAFKEADKVAKRFGKKILPSEVAFQEGITGTSNQIAKKAVKSVNKFGRQRNEILRRAESVGATVNTPEMLSPAIDSSLEMANSVNPIKRKAGRDGLKFIREYMAEIPANRRSNLGVGEVTDMKTSMYDAIGSSSYDTLKKTKPGKKIMKDLGRGLKESTENAVERATGEGARLSDLNERMGSLLTAGKTLDKEALKGLRKNIITKVDLLTLPFGKGQVTALGKLGDLLKTNYFKTKGGKALYKSAPALSIGTRRSLINLGEEE